MYKLSSCDLKKRKEKFSVCRHINSMIKNLIILGSVKKEKKRERENLLTLYR